MQGLGLAKPLSERALYRYNVGRRRKGLNNVTKNTKTIFR
jgi:hypothetical protein